MNAVTGISDHIGWAEFVTIGIQNKRPTILDRRRVELVEPGIPSAPYHHEGLELPLPEATKIIARTRKSIEDHCRRALSQAISYYKVNGIVLQESPMKQLPSVVAEVLASRRITCAADGMMYRESLVDAGTQLGLEVSRYPRKSDEVTAAAQSLGVARTAVAALITNFGREVGPPWHKEHQLAAASALRILSMKSAIRLG